MIKVGLTGGIGSGKTYISKIFLILKVPVYESDSRAKFLMQSDKQLISQLIEAFGNEIFMNNHLIPSILARMIFNDRNALETVNTIVHPYVMKDFDTWMKENNQSQYVVMESAILIESGLHPNFDKIICVSAPLKLRIERIMKRDEVGENIVKLRISNQLEDQEKFSKSDFIIYNDDKHMVIPQILEIHNQLLKLN